MAAVGVAVKRGARPGRIRFPCTSGACKPSHCINESITCLLLQGKLASSPSGKEVAKAASNTGKLIVKEDQEVRGLGGIWGMAGWLGWLVEKVVGGIEWGQVGMFAAAVRYMAGAAPPTPATVPDLAAVCPLPVTSPAGGPGDGARVLAVHRGLRRHLLRRPHRAVEQRAGGLQAGADVVRSAV